MTKKDLSKLEQYALSGEDLVKLVGVIDILTYPDLDNYKNLDDLFKKRDQVVVLFLTESKDFGHWLAMLLHRHKNAVEVFDSYGMKVDSHRTWLSSSELKSLDQVAPQMMDLIKKSKYHAVYNDKCLQEDGVNTCGRHVACRIMHKDMLLPKYIDLIEASGMSPDEFVTLITYKKLGK
jgi:hypothetical protein